MKYDKTQSKIDALSSTYDAEDYPDGVQMLLSMYRGRKLRIKETFNDGMTRVYTARKSFTVNNGGDIFPTTVKRGGQITFHKGSMLFGK